MTYLVDGFKTAITLTAITCLTTSSAAWAEEDLWELDEQPIAIEDPMESLNRSIYQFNTTFDDYLLEPTARGYDKIAPQPVKKGISNFFSNLSYPVVVVNDLLQGKFLQGGSDFARVIVNSTIGVLGIFDVASHLDMPKHNEDFGQTLATWGVSDGPYVMLPFLGPSSVRDSSGLVVDFFADPLYTIEGNGARNALVAAKAVDTRYKFFDESKLLDDIAIDPYAFLRSSYSQNREMQIKE